MGILKDGVHPSAHAVRIPRQTSSPMVHAAVSIQSCSAKSRHSPQQGILQRILQFILPLRQRILHFILPLRSPKQLSRQATFFQRTVCTPTLVAHQNGVALTHLLSTEPQKNGIAPRKGFRAFRWNRCMIK